VARRRSKGSDGPPPDVLKIDGGTFDGKGFYFSGSLVAGKYVEYTMRFSRTGKYRFACLIHPPMVGRLAVVR
jgi:plastocyanin